MEALEDFRLGLRLEDLRDNSIDSTHGKKLIPLGRLEAYRHPCLDRPLGAPFPRPIDPFEPSPLPERPPTPLQQLV